MFRKVAGISAGLVGSAISFVEGVMFSEIAKGVVPKYLFKPMGYLMSVASLASAASAGSKKEFAWRVVNILPTAAADVAIFCIEGPAQVMLFTAAIGAGGALVAMEIAYKYHNKELSGKEALIELVVQEGKAATVLMTLTLGGVGKVFELVQTGKMDEVHKAWSYRASTMGYVSGLKSLISSGAAMFKANDEQKADDQFHALEGQFSPASSDKAPEVSMTNGSQPLLERTGEEDTEVAAMRAQV